MLEQAASVAGGTERLVESLRGTQSLINDSHGQSGVQNTKLLRSTGHYLRHIFTKKKTPAVSRLMFHI